MSASHTENYAQLSSGELELSCRALTKSKTPRGTLAFYYRISEMLMTIVYNNSEMARGQNYAELSSRELELSCKAFEKSSTPCRTLAYHYWMSNVVTTIIYNNLAVEEWSQIPEKLAKNRMMSEIF